MKSLPEKFPRLFEKEVNNKLRGDTDSEVVFEYLTLGDMAFGEEGWCLWTVSH